MLVKEVAVEECYLVDPHGGPTEKDPPRLLEEDADTIGIDEYLGIYMPEDQLIRIFAKNVEIASRRLSCSPFVLKYIVHYHEQAHAIVHLGCTRTERTKALTDSSFRQSRLHELTDRFQEIEDNLHELLAQLLTYYALQRVAEKLRQIREESLAAEFMPAFSNLMKHQPARYRVEKYFDLPSERVVGSIRLIRDQELSGRLSTWLTIMAWP